MLAQLMVNQRVGGEAAFGKPGTVQPVAVEGPFEEAGLDQAHEYRGENGDYDQTVAPRWVSKADVTHAGVRPRWSDLRSEGWATSKNRQGCPGGAETLKHTRKQ